MSAPTPLPTQLPTGAAGIVIGRSALRQLHQSLLTHAADQAITILQEAGYAAGEGIHQAFCDWLPGHAGVDKPEDLDASLFSQVLAEFFQASGWGTLTVTPLGAGALALDSGDWAEAEPGASQMPMCFFSSGMLADFLGRISGETLASMEVECRSKGDGRCRFLTATPEVLQRVYEEMTQGKSYLEALGA
jgi:predicted hydrocarbon binding protein